MREIATRLVLAAVITAPLRDDRDPTRVRHSYAAMAMARNGSLFKAKILQCDIVKM